MNTSSVSRAFFAVAIFAAALSASAVELPRDVKYVAHQGEERLAPNHSIPRVVKILRRLEDAEKCGTSHSLRCTDYGRTKSQLHTAQPVQNAKPAPSVSNARVVTVSAQPAERRPIPSHSCPWEPGSTSRLLSAGFAFCIDSTVWGCDEVRPKSVEHKRRGLPQFSAFFRRRSFLTPRDIRCRERLGGLLRYYYRAA